MARSEGHAERSRRRATGSFCISRTWSAVDAAKLEKARNLHTACRSAWAWTLCCRGGVQGAPLWTLSGKQFSEGDGTCLGCTHRVIEGFECLFCFANLPKFEQDHSVPCRRS
eukprot:s1078_g19.t1